MIETKVALLDQNTANQIAAGEVVEKPASVVKELVENALDAGATNIEVSIYDGGIEYIRVVDNGSGMSAEDAKLAILRHATSKIRAAEDLLSLHSLGFRGEALPSIASISKFQLLTRPVTSEFATQICINGGESEQVSETGGNIGTTIIVEDLFFNVPARRKFLKTSNTEGRYINEMLSKIALSRPDVRFRMFNQDKEIISTPGNGNVVDTIAAIYGKKVSSEILPVAYSANGIEVSGYIGKPTLLKGTRQWQTLFVNGRTITNKMLAKAIDHAYQSQIPKAGFPFAVLNIVVDTTTLDVNVHPQKSEVKFSDDGAVYRVVFHALTAALTKPLSAVPSKILEDSPLQEFVVTDESINTSSGKENKASLEQVATEQVWEPETKVWSEDKSGQGIGGAAPVFKPTTESVWKTPEPKAEAVSFAAETLGVAELINDDFGAKTVFNPTLNTVFEQAGQNEESVATQKELDALPKLQHSIDLASTNCGIDQVWPIGQVDRTFIIAQSEDALYLIDQHAAHERILYDKLVKSHNNIPAQQFLVPLYLDAATLDIELIQEHHEEFMKLGVDVEAAGEDVLRVSSLPSDIKDSEAEPFIREILKMLSEMRNISASDLRQNVLHYTACHGAIKAGELLNMKQMRALILDLFNTEHPFTCPHGRPCMIEINAAELYKMFKRT